MMHKTLIGKFILLFLFHFQSVCSQDTLRLNLREADSLFLKTNYSLLAAEMNIEAQKALVIQAKLYPNPTFTADLNTYDPEHLKFFHIGATGQKGFQLEQLLRIGGKRKSEIELAKTNAEIAVIEFEKLVHTLKFQLHADLFTIGQQTYLLGRYNRQLALIDTLLTAYQKQADKGNIPLKDIVRLKGAYLKLNNDRAESLKNYYDAQTNLQTLLQTRSVIQFQFTEPEIQNYIKDISLAEIHAEALAHQPELLLLQKDKITAEQYLHYQKRSAIPDINLFTYYDQRGGAFSNQINTGISIPLPFFNRNQGNIQFAKMKIKESEFQLQQAQTELMSSLNNNYAFYLQSVNEYQKATLLYNEDFEITLNGMTDNFQKRNVSIIEFIDFFEAYNEVLTELTRIKTQVVISAEKLNVLIGKEIY